MSVEAQFVVHETGDDAVDAGSYICLQCGFGVALAALDTVPECPTCGEAAFRRASLFEQPTMSDHAPVENDPEEPAWLQRLRGESSEAGQFLAFEDDGGEVSTIPVPSGWTRIGRSVTADIRFDDPTVSRRHALIVKTDDGDLRVLDDRSLNGLFVNGERVEWSPLGDGDELEIGRYQLHLVVSDPGHGRLNPAMLSA